MNPYVASKMTEAELEAHVRRLIDDLGLWGYHPHDSRRSQPGWPDWVIIGKRMICRELKSERGALRPEQRKVGSLIIRAGGDWAVWRPRDLNGVIQRQLQEIA